MDYINISSEIKRFDEHLQQNPRTVFSAKFGDGKTYFLQKYMAHHQIWKDYTPCDDKISSLEDTYFVVLHPINYVVAKNEDIFEYIKHDILMQLYQEGRIDNIDYKAVLKALLSAAAESILPLIADIVRVLPGGKMANAFIQFGKKVKDKYNEKEKSIGTFFNGFANQKGSLYENDAYTQLIKTTLEHLKNPQTGFNCRKVLVVEDMDRLDPGHLFRILNVLGAHIDDNKEENKFGFDNIIVVLDYETTEHIFKHFYGETASYEGYMNKFVSTCVFHYSISRYARSLLIQKFMNDFDEDFNMIYTCGSEYMPQDAVTIRKIIEHKSVRQIEKILDNFDKVGTSTYTKAGVVYSTQCPLYGLAKLLLLLDEPNYSINSIASSICKMKEWWRFVGTFVSADARIEKIPVLGNEGLCTFRGHANEDRIIVSYEITCWGNTEGNRIDDTELVKKAIALACKSIKNGDNIRLA